MEVNSHYFVHQLIADGWSRLSVADDLINQILKKSRMGAAKSPWKIDLIMKFQHTLVLTNAGSVQGALGLVILRRV
jgi:hypothetical protein